MTIDQWQSDFTQGLVGESYTLIQQQVKLYGVEFGDKVKLSIIASFISSFVYEVLSTTPRGQGDLERETSVAHMLFKDAKEAVALAVASGVEGALKAHSGHDLHYYCEILPEPEALNTEPC